jgi:hypothetical protein
MSVSTEVKNNVLLISVDLSPAALEAAVASKSGKSKIVATTSGFMSVGPVRFSLNVIK